jgi:hypothetical protein
MEGTADNRAFPRLRTDFVMEVVAEAPSGGKCVDRALLWDVSGGGAKFMTEDARGYFPGQAIEIAICLPGTSDTGACMKGKGTVLRVESSIAKDGKKTNQAAIAIRINEPLHLERLRVARQGV